MPEKNGLPIVYVRGFAGGTSGSNNVVTDPFYGFNEGSTHIRIGTDNEPDSIDNAYVPGAHQAYVYRSHSGRYGLVNSEEGYQNLRRFLFGDHKAEAALVGHRLPRRDGTVWQAEVRLSVRGLQVVMHERMSAQWCPIQLPDGSERTAAGAAEGGADLDAAVPLVTPSCAAA